MDVQDVIKRRLTICSLSIIWIQERQRVKDRTFLSTETAFFGKKKKRSVETGQKLGQLFLTERVVLSNLQWDHIALTQDGSKKEALLTNGILEALSLQAAAPAIAANNPIPPVVQANASYCTSSKIFWDQSDSGV